MPTVTFGASLLTELLDALETDPDLRDRAHRLLGIGTARTNDDPIPLKRTGLPVRSLRAAIKRGDLPAVKVGRGFRVRPSDVQTWLDQGEVRPSPANDTTTSPAQRAIERAQRAGRVGQIRK